VVPTFVTDSEFDSRARSTARYFANRLLPAREWWNTIVQLTLLQQLRST
jgi:hypothetical protein